MKIITIANDKWERTLLESKNGGKVFLNPAQGSAKKVLVEYITACRTANPQETFLVLCSDFNTAAFLTLGRIFKALAPEKQFLILFGVSGSEASTIHSLQRKKNLEFFRTIYGKSYWNTVGRNLM